MNKEQMHGMRRISILVTAQTAFNLEKLAAMADFKYTGRVVDKLVREKMLSLKHEHERRLRGDDE